MQTTVTLPAAVRARAEAIAAQDGISLTNVVERVMSEAFGLPVPTYCLPKTNAQEELPLSKAS